MKLTDTLSDMVTHPTHLNLVARIDQENFDKVKSKVKRDARQKGEKLDKDYLERGILALKQYYAIAMLDPANGHAISAELDSFWHAHMLFSEEYTCFCEEVVGEYMHHKPLLHDNEDELARVLNLYNCTTDRLAELFTYVDTQFWPRRVEKADLICMHKGNQTMYMSLQGIRLYEPDDRLAA